MRCSTGIDRFVISYNSTNSVETKITENIQEVSVLVDSLTMCENYGFRIRATNRDAEGIGSSIVSMIVSPGLYEISTV